MKNLSYFIAMLFMATTFTSCEKVKDLANVEIETTFESSSITVTPELEAIGKVQGGTYKFDVEELIDFVNNQDIKDYLDQIEDFDVESLVISFEDVSESFNAETLKFIMFNSKQNKEFAFLNQIIENGSEITISEDDFEAIISILKDIENFSFKIQGDGCDKNNNFKVKAKLKVKITANPLN